MVSIGASPGGKEVCLAQENGEDGQSRSRRGERKRVLFLAHRTPFPPNKGEKIRAFWELQALSERCDVDLFCFYDDAEDEKSASHLREYCQGYYSERLSHFWSRARAVFALLEGRPFTTAFFCSRTMAARIQSALARRDYDRIFVFSSSMAQYVEATNSVPKVLDLVDVDSDKWRQYSSHTRWPWPWLWRREAQQLSRYESRLVQSFSTTVVCTDAEARLLRSKAPLGAIAVLENSFNVDQYDPKYVVVSDEIRSWRPYIIFSGSMDYFPNVDAVMYFYSEVLPLVRREIPNVRFVIAGRNPHRSVARLQSDPAIKVTGSVPDIKPYLCGAAAAVVPMRIARGVQNKILEAIAAGTPVVSTAAAAAALPATLASLLTVADTPQDLATSLINILRNGSPVPPGVLRSALKNHIQNLDLQSQLESLVLGTNADPQTAESPD